MMFHADAKSTRRHINRILELTGPNNGIRIVMPGEGELRISRQDILRSIGSCDGIAEDGMERPERSAVVPYFRFWSLAMSSETKNAIYDLHDSLARKCEDL